ncbi:MAG: helix-turn-helix domain-containing protein [Bacteroidetes bacterium]|nr:helix-turn-helix domain-containing protein [Bacteroidota bacterium]
MDVGANIKKLREFKNFTQTSMAEAIGVSQKTYSNIENAKNNITVEDIDKIAKALGVSFNKILELNAEAILNNSSQVGGISQINTAPSYNYLNEKILNYMKNCSLKKTNGLKY